MKHCSEKHQNICDLQQIYLIAHYIFDIINVNY